MHFLVLNGSFFSGDDRDILKEEVKTQMAQSSPLNPTIFSKPKVLVFLSRPRPDWGY
jgi:hypothetical protein